MNRLKLLREAKGMKQSELGTLLNVKDAAISKYESGKIQLTGDTLLKLAEIFEVTTDYLLGNEVEGKNIVEKIEKASVDRTSVGECILRTGYGYDEMAKKLGIDEDELLEYVGDHDDIPYAILERISEICNVSTDVVLGLKNKSRNRDYDNTLPFKFNYDISNRIKALCAEHKIDMNSSYLETLLCLSDKEVFYLLEYGFIPHIDVIIKLAKEFHVSTDFILCQIDEKQEKAMNAFSNLNDDNKDIIVGKIKEFIKEQYYEESVAAVQEKRNVSGK